jgi:hypothetical protein
MKRWFVLIGMVSVALFVAAFVYTEQNETLKQGKGQGIKRFGQGQLMLQRFDSNQDGQIEQAEWIAVFKTIDINGDGILSKEEIAKQQEQIKQEVGKNIFQRFDKNSDGLISKDEFPGREEKFATLDVNGDGQISPDEMKTAGEKMRKMKDEGGKIRKNKNGDSNSVQ